MSPIRMLHRQLLVHVCDGNGMLLCGLARVMMAWDVAACCTWWCHSLLMASVAAILEMATHCSGGMGGVECRVWATTLSVLMTMGELGGIGKTRKSAS